MTVRADNRATLLFLYAPLFMTAKTRIMVSGHHRCLVFLFDLFGKIKEKIAFVIYRVAGVAALVLESLNMLLVVKNYLWAFKVAENFRVRDSNLIIRFDDHCLFCPRFQRVTRAIDKP
jgi:hypothetical protein